MSKTRKLISVVVALMMVVSMFAMTANAANYYYEDEVNDYTQVWALSEPVDNGDGTYTVDVSLTTNYATGPIQFYLTNTDTSVAAIKSVTLGSAIPADYNAYLNVTKSTGKVMINSDTSADETITAVAINGVIATVVYTYSGSGSAEIAIEDDAKSATNPGGSLIAARMTDDDIVTGDPVTGQNVTVGASVIIGASAVAPTLAVIDGTMGVIDTSRTLLDENTGEECTGYIYGIDVDNGDTVDSVFEVVGDGTMDWDGNTATGSMVYVLDNDGNVVESYVVVIFGDVNGDGEATPDDASGVEDHDAWMYGLDVDTGDDLLGYGGRLPAYAAFAADITGDGEATPDDASLIEDHDAWMFGIDVDTGEDVLGCGGRITVEYVISLL